jgi:mannose-1-phosphate guanylyltransferase
MKALILAGGFGVRLREVIHGRPKHMVMVNGQPFLRHVLKLLKRNGIAEVVLSIGYLAQYIRDEFAQNNEGMTIEFSEDDRPLGTGGAMKNAQSFFTEDFFIVNGDTSLDIDFSQLMSVHKQSKALLTIVATDKHKNKGGIILSKNNRVTDFISNPNEEVPFNGVRNAGVYVASPGIFTFIPEFDKVSFEKEIIPSLVAHELVDVFTVSQDFIDVGSCESYLEAQKFFQ